LQPSLEEKLPFPVATLLMGVIWAVWHLPLWLIKDASQSSTNFFLFLCFCIFLSFLLAALYKLTHSVLACTLLHAWSNVMSNMFAKSPDLKMILMYLSLTIAAAVIYILVDRKAKAEKSVTKAV
jgi:membrane protease YdiL (CAAX protease family)